MSTCLETWPKVLRLSKEKRIDKKAVVKEEAKVSSPKKDETPTPQDHYVYESIIAEIGY